MTEITSGEPRNKRKQFVPQQHGASDDTEIDVVHSDAPVVTVTPERRGFTTDEEKDYLKAQLRHREEEVHSYKKMLEEREREQGRERERERMELLARVLPVMHQPQVELERCLRAICAELVETVKSTIKDELEKRMPSQRGKPISMPTKDTRVESNTTPNATDPHQLLRRVSSASTSLQPGFPLTAHGQLMHPFMQLPFYYGQGLPSFSAASAAPIPAPSESEFTDSPMYREMNTPKKKRTKVTDTRLSPRTSKPADLSLPKQEMEPNCSRAFEAYGSGNPLLRQMGPSAIMAHASAMVNGSYCGEHISSHSPSDSDRQTGSPDLTLSGSSPLPGQPAEPSSLHLRKAKLMFFYVRAPQSQLLKNYFCDITFNKKHTQQLVKWFSNFREFYYNKVEEYAKQQISDKVDPENIHITMDSELFKTLNTHYNKNNQIEVPASFLETVRITVQEFMKAMLTGKAGEPSWKKPIYKIIHQRDDPIPEFFRSESWLAQLTD